VDSVRMVDVDAEPLRAHELDGKHVDVGQPALNRVRELAVKLAFLFMNLGHSFLSLFAKNGRRAPISPAGEMWFRQDSTRIRGRSSRSKDDRHGPVVEKLHLHARR